MTMRIRLRYFGQLQDITGKSEEFFAEKSKEYLTNNIAEKSNLVRPLDIDYQLLYFMGVKNPPKIDSLPRPSLLIKSPPRIANPSGTLKILLFSYVNGFFDFWAMPRSPVQRQRKFSDAFFTSPKSSKITRPLVADPMVISKYTCVFGILLILFLVKQIRYPLK